MSNYRRRSTGTLEQRIWRWLRKQPGPVRVDDVVAGTEEKKADVKQALCRLVRKGSAIRTGRTVAVRYTATDVLPDDLRGTAPGSVAQLNRVHAERLGTGRKPVRTWRRRDASPLAQAWPSPIDVKFVPPPQCPACTRFLSRNAEVCLCGEVVRRAA